METSKLMDWLPEVLGVIGGLTIGAALGLMTPLPKKKKSTEPVPIPVPVEPEVKPRKK